MTAEQTAALAAIQAAASPAIKAMLVAYIVKVHDGKTPADFGQGEHARFTTFVITRLAEKAGIDLPPELKTAIYAVLTTDGMVNASQFRQKYSDADLEGGPLLPASKRTKTPSLDAAGL